ncbi:unnamed protein product [Euphydryas editha]|uniref:Uncharacterized protein n=1 Tax=Euphydryas editha TaxID=104508 RepID=A0AAU9UXJ8_EUPED|nr:unnamed protein product [Euphydryas editha]
MVITRKDKFDTPHLSTGGVGVCIIQEIKLLGVVLSHKLTFNVHVTSVCKKAITFYHQLSAKTAVRLRVRWVRLFSSGMEPPKPKTSNLVCHFFAPSTRLSSWLCAMQHERAKNTAQVESEYAPIPCRHWKHYETLTLSTCKGGRANTTTGVQFYSKTVGCRNSRICYDNE